MYINLPSRSSRRASRSIRILLSCLLRVRSAFDVLELVSVEPLSRASLCVSVSFLANLSLSQALTEPGRGTWVES